MKNKKIIIIITVVLLVVAGTVAALLLKKGNKDKKKTYEPGSVEAESEILLNKWLGAMAGGKTDDFISCCYTDALMDYHMNQTGLDRDKFKEYLKHVYVHDDFEYRNLEIRGKTKLDEDAYFEINKQLGDKDKIDSMYKISYTYELKYENEWTKVEENVNIFLIKGQCYVDNLSDIKK